MTPALKAFFLWGETMGRKRKTVPGSAAYWRPPDPLLCEQYRSRLRDFDADAMMQLEEVAADNMKRRDSRYLLMHPYKITQCSDGRWCTNVRDSNDKIRTIRCAQLEKLHEKLIAHYKELEKDKALTFPVVCKEWLDTKLKHKEITGSSHTKYMTDYNRFFSRDVPFCSIAITDIADSDLRKFIKDTIVEFQLTKKAYKQLHILLRGALLYAKEEGYTDYSAGTFFYDLVLSDRLFTHKPKPAPETQFFSDQEASKLMTWLWEENDIRGLGLILMFQTGMRVGELAALRRIDVIDGEIRIAGTEETYTDPVSGKKVCEVVDHAKTEAGERRILLPEQAEKTLKAIRAINPFGEYLFMDKHGDRIRAKRFNTWLHRSCKKIGIPERSTHKIRKTYASILLSNHVDDRLVTSQMGHTDIAMTRSAYYYNRDTETENRRIISDVISF